MDNQTFYLIQPAELAFSPANMSLQQRRNMLRELLQKHGALWATTRSRAEAFMKSVQQLDRFLGTGEELADCAFENSPSEILPIGSVNEYDPLFGYYEPARVLKFHSKLRTIPGPVIEEWEARPEPEGEILGQVVHAFLSVFSEAAARKCAVAIDHG